MPPRSRSNRTTAAEAVAQESPAPVPAVDELPEQPQEAGGKPPDDVDAATDAAANAGDVPESPTTTGGDDPSTGPTAAASAGPTELVTLTDPCAHCYPHGWPSKVDGAHVSCHHGLSIRYGQPVAVTPEDAARFGF